MHDIEISNNSPEEATSSRNPPDDHQVEQKVRLYNQSDEKRIDLDTYHILKLKVNRKHV